MTQVLIAFLFATVPSRDTKLSTACGVNAGLAEVAALPSSKRD